ncbi:MAG: alginate lyase family protein [Lentisphaeria bacterium]|nr:alginate lyase family protein [Lentisphaeria bacterium]
MMNRLERFRPPVAAELLENNNFFELYPFDGGGSFIQQEIVGSVDDRKIAKAVSVDGALNDFGPLEKIDFLKFERWSTIEKSCWINRMYFLVPLARTAKLTGDRALAGKIRHILLDFAASYPPPATCDDTVRLHKDVLYARDHDYNAKGFDFDAPIPYQWFDFQPASRIVNILHAAWFLKDMGIFSEADLGTLDRLLYLHGQNIFWTESHVELKPGNHQALRSMALLLVSAYFEDLPESREWQALAVKMCEYHVLNDFLPDGMLIDLSPSYHFFETWIIRDMIRIAQQIHIEFLSAVYARAEKAFGVCRALCQPDGCCPVINDAYALNLSGFLAALPPAKNSLENYLLLPDAGMAIYHENDDFLLYDCSPLVSKLAHYHAGKQAVTLFVHGIPFLTDSGCCSYDDPDFSGYYKQASAHSSLLIDGHGDGTLQGRYLWLNAAKCTLSDWKDGSVSSQLTTEADGWSGIGWERKIAIREGERTVILDDLVSSDRTVGMTFIFNLHPDVTVRKEGTAAVLEHRGQNVRIAFPGDFEVRDSMGYQDFTKIPGRQLIFRASGSGGEFRTRILWD